VQGSPAASPPPTAIIAAMPEELAPLRAQLQGAGRLRAGGLEILIGRLGHAPVALVITGDGERNARRGIAALLATVPVSRLLMMGVAGALTPGLSVGQLVVADSVLREGGAALRADAAQVAAAVRCTGARSGIAVSAERIADTPAEKRRLWQLAGSPEGPAVVDLESAAFAEIAAHAGAPWLCLRAVSDTAEEGLPALLNRSRDDGGAVRRGRVMRGLLTEPQTLPVLMSLRSRIGRCAALLAAAVHALVTSAAPPGGADPASAAPPEGDGAAPGGPVARRRGA
jgi:adenosylhomocysteine nucleosidase